MKFQWFLLIFIATVVTGCKSVGGNDSPTPSPMVLFNLKNEDFAIYTLLLTTGFPSEMHYLIEQHADCLIHPLEPENFSEIHTNLRADTVADYAKKSIQELTLVETFSQSDKFIVVNEQNYWDKIFWGDIPCGGASCLSLKKLQKDYSEAKGVFHLSPIGYSEDHTQALVCTGLNDGRGYVWDVQITLLSYEANGWSIQGFLTIQQR